MVKAMEKLDLMVVVDPYPTVSAVMQDRQDGLYLLPATQRSSKPAALSRRPTGRCSGVIKVVDPLFESQAGPHDHQAVREDKFGFSDRSLFKNIALDGDEPNIEDLTREFNGGMWTIGYTAQSPRAHEDAHGEPAHL